MRIFRNSSYQPKHVKTNDKKTAMPLLRYLVYFLIVTTTVTGVSLSRYATSSSAADLARVAKFDVVVTPVDWVDGGFSVHETDESVIYNFNIENNSEVAVRARLVDLSADSPIIPESVTDPSTPTAVTVDADGWFLLATNDTRLVNIVATGSFGGKVYHMRMEYEQIDA